LAFDPRADQSRAGGCSSSPSLWGRPRLESEEAKVLAAKKLANDKSLSIDDICKTLNISRSTYYRYLAMDSDDPPGQVG